MTKQERLRLFEKVDIYPVTCERLSNGRSDIDVVKGIIDGGAKIVQLREKEMSKRAFCELAVKVRELTAKSGLLLIINDHVDIALACDADGVHLGQDDMPLLAARRIAPDLIIGVSTHDKDEAMLAQDAGADYVNIGPIFKTSTKEGLQNYLGPENIGTISKELKIPFTVMGGINLDNIDKVIGAGAKKIAVVSAITLSDDISSAVKELKSMFK
ncbi:thiamine phosphate synthase [Thermodesulfobacteriota bacterium]